MKFHCYKEDLIEALQFVIRAVAVKPMTPILAGIYIKVEGSKLELQANNFSTGIITRISVSTEEPGEVVVSGKRFQEFVRNMPDDTITFSDEENDSFLKLESGGASVDLLKMSVADFPKVKTPETEHSFTLTMPALYELIKMTVFAVAKEPERPIFTGCCFEIKNNVLSLIATNTNRLALSKANLEGTHEDCSFIVPAESLRGILTRIDPQEFNKYVTMNYSKRYLTVTIDNIFLTARLIDGIFPPYERVIPTSHTTEVMVSTPDFKNAVDFVLLMAKETEYNTVKFRFCHGDIEISSTSPEVGGAVKTVDAKIDGDDLDIAFNGNYIADMLKTIDSIRLNIKMNDRYSPAMFTEPGNPNYVYIATPVRE